jgi:YidC/Oxa1 family membrane protein insertase
MGEEKRFILFLVLTMLVVVLTPPLFQWINGPPPRPPVAAGPAMQELDQDDGQKPEGTDEAVDTDQAQARNDNPPANEPVKAEEQPAAPEAEPELETRTLGSTDPATGFLMQVLLTNRGAAVQQLELASFQNEDRSGPLRLLSTGINEQGSFELALKGFESVLEERKWQILPGDPEEGDGEREVVRFQTQLPEQGLVITKTYTLQKSNYMLGLDIDIKNSSQKNSSVAYRLGGPRGLVLEGAWYATKKREAAIADGTEAHLNRHTVRPPELVKGAQKILELADAGDIITRDKWQLPADWFDRFDRNHDRQLSGEEINMAANYLAGGERDRFTERPVRFAGVDGQFFCALLVIPTPTSLESRWDVATSPVLHLTDAEMTQLKRRGKLEYPDRSDVSVEIESKNFDLSAGDDLHHSFALYAGPRKRATIELAVNDPAIAQAVMNYQGALFIFPASLVSLTASTTLVVLQFFHSLVGNWGVAIIMLTVMVRLLMFPLSRKQALSMAKMQALKPELDVLREKYKNDKEKFGRAQMELWRKHKVSPVSGCLPVFIQMPIFIGLWQGLQSSVDLRQATFLWIDNLAAPDGPSVSFFHWGENIPIISWLFGPYFNLLPAILIGLFLIQQKMFTPPKSATPDPQVEMQQKMMTYMLVFFGYIFWRLPSGLCLYYIASTLWGISERKLLPKLQHADTSLPTGQEHRSDDGANRKSRESDAKGNWRDARGSRAERRAPTLADRLQELLKKAEKR